MNLYERFTTLLRNYTKDFNVIDKLWRDLYEKYSQKHRAYHNLNHLEEIFGYYDSYKDKIEQLYNKLNKETEFFAEKKIGSEFSNLVGQNTKDL